MWLTAANLGFTAGGVLLYWLARRRLLTHGAEHGRKRELLASLLVSLLGVGGFLLAHVGMNVSWTDRAVVTDLNWLFFGLASAALLLTAHVLLRLVRSRADELVLPVAAFLAILGLINIYVSEARDANAYVSTVALPALRDYQESIAADPSLAAPRREEILSAVGTVPNELDYEDGSRSRLATVLDPGWLNSYNAVVRRYGVARSLHSEHPPDLPVREVRLYDNLRRQLLAVGLGLLVLPLLLFAATRVPLAKLSRKRLPIVAAGALPLGIVAGALLGFDNRSLPPLLSLGGQSLTIYEPLKLGLVIALALSLAPPGSPMKGDIAGRRLALGAVALAIGAMIWRDPGAGIALLAIAGLMMAASGGPRRRYVLIAAGLVALGTLPVASRVLDAHLPETVRARVDMWTEPWGSYQRAEIHNVAVRSAGRLAELRASEQFVSPDVDAGASSLVSARPPPVDPTTSRYAERIEQELLWRLDALGLQSGTATPLIPTEPVDELLLLEAEELWAKLGGFRVSPSSADGAAFRARLEEVLRKLEQSAASVDRVVRGGDGLSQARPHEGRAELPSVVADNFQLQRALFALKEGGAFGTGLGLGRPEAVPGVMEDVPLAALGEALGLAGIVLLVLFVLLLTGRGIELAQRQTRPAFALLVVGLASLLGVQALVSLGGISGAVPFTGLTFPFISRSGTGVLTSFLALALIMAFAARSRRAPGTESAGKPRRLLLRDPLRAAGFPAAFALVLVSIALLQLTGRTLTPGPLMTELPGPRATFLHAGDQWDAPGYRTAPGSILDRDGRTLSTTTSLGGGRVYPHPEVATALAHTLRQLDLAFADELVGAKPSSALIGPSLVTTIDSEVQEAVDEAIDEGAREGGLADLESLRGAVVLLDATDGAIVALASRPTFSLAELGDPIAWARAEANERRSGFSYRHLNRAIHGFYPPGSAFKTVTAAAVLELGLHTVYSEDFDYRDARQTADGLTELSDWHQLRLLDGPPITDANHPHVRDWLFNLEEAFAYSDNVAFAEMGLELGAADLVGFARRFGFERPITVAGLGTATSVLDEAVDKDLSSRFLAETDSNLARTAFGQGQALATPLQMTLVAAAIANRGTIMEPYVVAGWKASDGTWIRRYQPRVLVDTQLSPATLDGLRKIMHASVTYGIVRNASVNPGNANPGVAGKTGSAEWTDEGGPTHSWFIGYFPAEAPRLALAVVVERGGPGPAVAARIARRIFASRAVHDYLGKT